MSERHEPSDINARVIVWTAVAVVLVIALVSIAVYVLYPHAPSGFEPDERAWAASIPQDLPALQTSPSADFERWRREQQSALSSYGWIDREQGIAHIPIEEAMRELPRHRPQVVIGPAEEGQ